MTGYYISSYCMKQTEELALSSALLAIDADGGQ
jgi:hypothetical protein